MIPVPPASSLSAIGKIANAPGALKPDTSSGPEGFSNLLENFVKSTNESQVTSDQSIQDLVTGKTDNVQQVVMAVANAEMSFQLFMEIRNKLVDSYNELMRMQF